MKISKETLLIASFIAILSIGYILSYIQKNQVKTSAVGPTATFTLTPTSATIPANQEQVLNVVINTDAATNKVSGLDLTFNATGDIQFSAIDVLSPKPLPDAGAVVRTAKMIYSILPAKAHASYIMVDPDLTSLTPAADANLPTQVTLQVKYKATANGGTIALDTAASQVVGNITGNVYAIAGTTSGTYTTGNVTITPPTATPTAPTGTTLTPTVPAGGATVNVIDTPKTGNFPLNTEQSMTVNISTGNASTQKISGLDLTFKATGVASITAVDVTIPRPLPSPGDVVRAASMIRNITATSARVSYVMVDPDLTSLNPAPDANLPSTVTMVVKYKGTADGAGTIVLDTAASQVVGNISSNTYSYGTVDTGNFTFGSGSLTPTVTGTLTPTVTGTITPTVTITPPTGSVVLNMKLKFQGILATPTNGTAMNIKVMVGKDGFLSGAQTGTFTVNAQGVWSGAVGFNDVTPGSGYRVYVKGPKHVQKKVCAAAPTETKAGTYRCSTGEINIVAGQNTLDFSNIYMLVGDLPNQDGVVDAYDTSLIQNNLGKTDAPTLANADLNLDGIVDTQDWSLVIASLNVKYDEL